MATIKDMAQNHITPYMVNNDDYESMKDTYIAGANAVLKEIEKALVYPKNDGQRIMIEKKIKELKGD